MSPKQARKKGQRRQAAIKSKDTRYPFALRVTLQYGTQVRWDRTDSTTEGNSFMVINTSVKASRKLAQWILDNTEG